MSSRLAQLARSSPADAPSPAGRERARQDDLERCELCSEPIGSEHRHLVDLAASRLLCVCRACSLLFDRREAGGGHYRLVPDRRLRIEGFMLDDAQWDGLGIPVELAFFFHSTPAGRVVAFYPGPLGATECLLALDAWAEIEAANPVLAGVEPDVEALLLNRTRAGREQFVVPVDECYALVGLIRTRWQGLNGGQDAWDEIGRFFDRLRSQSTVVGFDGKEA